MVYGCFGNTILVVGNTVLVFQNTDLVIGNTDLVFQNGIIQGMAQQTFTTFLKFRKCDLSLKKDFILRGAVVKEIV